MSAKNKNVSAEKVTSKLRLAAAAKSGAREEPGSRRTVVPVPAASANGTSHGGGQGDARPPQASRTSKAKKGAKTPAAQTPNTKGQVRHDKDAASAKKLSAVDAAARLLGETKKPMTCPELIEAMSKKGYWTSPGGKTPAATLYSAILRELQTKGKEARFKKTERGKFAWA
jgi:hypothetical protein